MPQRLRLYDLRLGRLPQAIGLCAADLPSIRTEVNAACQRLMLCKEMQDEGPYGSWAEMAFTVDRSDPFITTPREVARFELATICNRPIVINNQFFEYLQFGNGRLPKCPQFRTSPCMSQIYSRNNVPTFRDLSPAPQLIYVYMSDPSDDGKRVLIQGLDNLGNVVYSQDGNFRVTGQYVSLHLPFVSPTMPFSQITGVQKDLTNGPVQIFQVDPKTGAQVLLLTMEPSEQVASYRRYYFDKLPFACCPIPSQTSSQPLVVTAICKLEFIPVFADPDYTYIQNEQAIIEECQSARYDDIDTQAAKQMSSFHHKNAVQFLNGEITHYLGLDFPAVQFKPYGSASLRKQRIGTLV